MRAMFTPLKVLAGKALPTIFYYRFTAHAALQHQLKDVWQAKRLENREDVWDDAIRTIGVDAPVLYLEFGVWQGYSIKYFASRFTNPASRFRGFDSFIGLPESWASMDKGSFTTGGEMPQIDDDRVDFVKGWFQNTFSEVVEAIADHPDHKIVIHFDADIYSSTMFLLSQLYPLADGYHFIFDEFTGEENLALLNYVQGHGSDISYQCSKYLAGLPAQVFGYLTTNRSNYVPA